MIVLQGANVVAIKDKHHPFRFTVTNRDRSYDFEAESEAVMNEWITAINQVIKVLKIILWKLIIMSGVAKT